MSRCREHGVRPALGALAICLVNGRAHPKALGLAADLVQRDEAVVAIERGVLEAFGHHRAAVLLQPHRKAHAAERLKPLAPESASFRSQSAAGNRKRTGGDPGRCDAHAPKPIDVPAIGFGGRVGKIDIGAVDRKAGDDLLDRALQNVLGKVRRQRVLPREARRVAGEPLSSLAISLSMMQIFRCARLRGMRRSPGKLAVGLGEARLRVRIDQRAEGEIRKLISCRALDLPVVAQSLVRREDLLDDQIEGRPTRPLSPAK